MARAAVTALRSRNESRLARAAIATPPPAPAPPPTLESLRASCDLLVERPLANALRQTALLGGMLGSVALVGWMARGASWPVLMPCLVALVGALVLLGSRLARARRAGAFHFAADRRGIHVVGESSGRIRTLPWTRCLRISSLPGRRGRRIRLEFECEPGESWSTLRNAHVFVGATVEIVVVAVRDAEAIERRLVALRETVGTAAPLRSTA